MKIIIISIFLLLLTIGNTATAQDKTEYIEFEAIGNQVKYKPPVFISKRKLKMALTENQLDVLRQMKKNLPNFNKKEYMDEHFHCLVTDENTYTLLFSFITGHNGFYSNNSDKINPAGSLDIVANGKTYNLFYKTEKDFFKELIDFLNANNCDKKVIKELGNIH